MKKINKVLQILIKMSDSGFMDGSGIFYDNFLDKSIVTANNKYIIGIDFQYFVFGKGGPDA